MRPLFSISTFRPGDGLRVRVLPWTLAVVGLFALSATAQTQTVVGEAGSDGMPGIGWQPGTPGGDGGSVEGSESATTTREIEVLAGSGGTGGAGGQTILPNSNGGLGGAGGLGGDATASIAGRSVIRTADATAVGGAGGDGGFGGANPAGETSMHGAGGAGGAAWANAEVEANNDGADSLSIVTRVESQGGDGGDGTRLLSGEITGSPNRAGAGGAANSQLDVSGAGHLLVGTSRATGGDGGAGLSDAPTGNGGDAFARTTASQGVGAARTQLIAVALGGDGGLSGSGGVATSEVSVQSGGTLRNRGTEVTAASYGGDGTVSAAGGRAEATAEGVASETGSIQVKAEARGGDGYLGSDASATASASSPLSRATVGTLIVAGGALAQDSQGNGLAGRNLSIENTVDGQALYLDLIQSATAGAGAPARREGAGGDGGDGGNAESSLTRTNNGELGFEGGSGATGGEGGHAYGQGHRGGEGGTGHSTAVISAPSNNVILKVSAAGGNGGRVVNGARGGSGGGVSFGVVHATSETGGDVAVGATGTGGRGGDSASSIGTTAGRGGDGATIALSNAVDGETEGRLSLFQRAQGGRGGQSSFVGGDGGGAYSDMFRSFERPETEVGLTATGGDGGSAMPGHPSPIGEAGVGGDGVALGYLTQKGGDLTLYGSAEGGAGRVGGLSEVNLGAELEGDGHALQIGLEIGGGAKGSDLGSGSSTSQSVAIATGNSAVIVYDRAFGGDGSTETEEGVTGELGGRGISYAEGRNAGDAPVFVSSTAAGGQGGRSTRGDGGSGGEAFAEAVGISTGGGDVEVRALQAGGGGGISGRLSLVMGRGGHTSISNAVSGSTSGQLTLVQSAFGGRVVDGPFGGDAYSHLSASNPGGGALDATSEATGGQGTGDASTSIRAADHSGANLVARAIATGGDAFRAELDGGVAQVWASGTSSAGGAVDVLASATGGAGGFQKSGGDISLVDAVRGETAGLLVLSQEALGGLAGLSSRYEQSEGRGGHAASRVTASNRLGGDLHLSSRAEGGGQPSRTELDFAGSGGEATSFAEGRGVSEAFVRVDDEAIGGSGYSGGDASSTAIGHSFSERGGEVISIARGGEALVESGQAGNARSSAIGTATTGALRVQAVAHGGDHVRSTGIYSFGTAEVNRATQALASASATGFDSQADSLATGRSGRVGETEIRIEAYSTATGDGELTTEARAGFSARSVLSDASPSPAIAAMAAAEGIHDRNGEWTRVGLAVDSRELGPDIVLRSEVGIRTSTEIISLDGVYLSFLDVEFQGLWTAGTRFEIRNGSNVLLDQRFSTEEEAAAFFSSVVSLAALLPTPSYFGLDLRFILEMTTPAEFSGVAAVFVVGTKIVPEPGTGLLVFIGLVALGFYRESRPA